MESTFNDFLNEINEISPPARVNTCGEFFREMCLCFFGISNAPLFTHIEKQSNENRIEWQECFDEGTGFPYYWNVHTNAVTWEMPTEYKDWLENGKNTKQPPKVEPKVAPLFPGVSLTTAPESVKIYKIQGEPKRVSPTNVRPTKLEKKKKSKPPRNKSSDSEDEKIVLISSYGGDTDSDEEEEEDEKENIVKSNQSSQCNSPKPVLNSAVSSRVNSDAEDMENKEIPQPAKEEIEKVPDEKKAPTSGFALVAGYGESDEEESVQENGTIETPSTPISHSTLFPARKPIDINQFMETKPQEKHEEVVDIDKKAFQRKRRIGINLPAMPRRMVVKQEEGDSEHKGFGYKPEVAETTSFKSGGVAFVKADVLYPNVPEKQNGVIDDANKTQSTVKEKLTFLSEGKEPVSGVQMMLIQLETLFDALKYGSLDSNYLNKWIKDTERELVKLEEEAAPNGWLLEWDSVQKRYYYRNKGTNECQWEYPQAEAEVPTVVPSQDDDAMDICTTPPPLRSDVIEEEVALQIPTISPTPMGSEDVNLESPPPEELLERQPLPPGVDCLDSKTESKPNNLSLVLNDFYSDIAAIEHSNSSPKPEVKEPAGNVGETGEPVKKKKKVKMASGISMKKKGVSKLVEKWKNVQKDLE